MKTLKKSVVCFLVGISLLTIAGCFEDSNTSAGEKGVLRYSLYTDYEAEGNLATGILPTKVTLSISVRRISWRTDIGDYRNIRHVVTPSEDAEIFFTPDPEYVPDFKIKVSKPGEYIVETKNSDEVIDHITLKFDDPETIDAVVKIRKPYESGLNTVKHEGVTTVVEGSQVAFIPFFVTKDGTRMIGSGPCKYTADPEWMVVPDKHFLDYTEGNYWVSISSEGSFYFIEDGSVTFHFLNEESGMTGTKEFLVTPIPGKIEE